MEEAVGIFILVFLVYFMPTIVAVLKHKRNASAIFILNLLLGWTILGWIISLVWSVTYEEERQKNLKEEKYSAEEKKLSKKPWWKPQGIKSWIVAIFLLLFVLPMILSFIPTEQAKKTRDSGSQQETINVLSAREIATKTEKQVKDDYGDVISDYSSGGLTPSKKVKITNFDAGDFNVQIDYAVATNKPVYIGYSFADSPKRESSAWQIVGFSKPSAQPKANPGVRERTVVYWENTPEIKPFKLVQAIYNKDGTVGKISFAMEDLTTAQSPASLYYTEP